MCMKTPYMFYIVKEGRKFGCYMFLTVIALGPNNNPKQNIDIYLEPLIKELKMLWKDDILTYDVYTG